MILAITEVMNRCVLSTTLLTVALSGLGAALSGCGKDAFVVGTSQKTQSAPGTFVVPPKVDILLAEDDTGSIADIYGTIQTETPKFLSQLEVTGWNYHFGVTGLTTPRDLNQILASKHDGNWGAEWVSPFPGASPLGPDRIGAAFFKKPADFTGFVSTDQIQNKKNGTENGLETLRTTLLDKTPGTGFLRSDALLVVIVMGNGEDTSRVNLCTRSDGVVVPCSDNSAQWSLNYFKSEILGVKGASPGLVKVFASVAATYTSNCHGAPAYPGTRYQSIANDTGGKTFDICTQSVPAIMSAINDSLQSIRGAYRTRYLVIPAEPEPSSLIVTRYPNGDKTHGVSIPQDANNGFTYAGHVDNVPAIDYPVPLNRVTGFAIELHGSAKLSGYDTADVTWKPVGAKDSSK